MYLAVYGGIFYGLTFPLWGLKFVKLFFGEEHNNLFTMIVLLPQALLIYFLIGFIGKLIFTNRNIRCSKCKKISQGDVVFCPKCGTRVGWDDWGIKK